MLIEYTGVPTGKCKKFLIKKQIKIQAIAALGVTVVFVIPIICAILVWKNIAGILFIPLLVYDLFVILPPGKNSQKIFMPKRIVLDLKDEIIVRESAKTKRVCWMQDVKKVLDYGDWYYLVFNYSSRDPYFVCQKNLLSKGTLQEFEALFEGKIERRSI